MTRHTSVHAPSAQDRLVAKEALEDQRRVVIDKLTSAKVAIETYCFYASEAARAGVSVPMTDGLDLAIREAGSALVDIGSGEWSDR